MSQKIYARTVGDDCYVNYEMYMEPFIEDGTIILDGEASFNSDILELINQLVRDYEYDGLQWWLETHLKKKNKKKYSPNELHRIKEALENTGSRYYTYVEELRTTILSIVMGKKYEARTIRGCCQGDYATVYVEEDLPQEVVDEIEAIYFGTGTEIIIDDSDEEITDPHEISGYSIYTSKYSEDDLKAEIADQAGCDVEDIVLWMHDGYTKVSKYRLAE